MKPVNTIFRLERATRAFKPFESAKRRLAAPLAGVPSAQTLRLDGWHESSLGDPMCKLVLIVSGQADLEGPAGGWVLLPNHLIFIPANRPFALRAAKGTLAHVAHLDAARCDWRRDGCWVTAAPPLAREMLAHGVHWSAEEARDFETARLFFATLAHLCREWFCKPRIQWLPAAQSPEMRAIMHYLRERLADATLGGACAAAGLPGRTLQRRCQQELQFGWRELVREARILRAMELLAEGGDSIGAVAQEIGFKSSSAFTLAFSRRVGVSPSEFVRRHGAPAIRDGRAEARPFRGEQVIGC